MGRLEPGHEARVPVIQGQLAETILNDSMFKFCFGAALALAGLDAPGDELEAMLGETAGDVVPVTSIL